MIDVEGSGLGTVLLGMGFGLQLCSYWCGYPQGLQWDSGTGQWGTAFAFLGNVPVQGTVAR